MIIFSSSSLLHKQEICLPESHCVSFFDVAEVAEVAACFVASFIVAFLAGVQHIFSAQDVDIAAGILRKLVEVMFRSHKWCAEHVLCTACHTQLPEIQVSSAETLGFCRSSCL